MLVVGDVVILVGKHDAPAGTYGLNNKTGIIRCFAPSSRGDCPDAGVEFDEQFVGGHDCHGKALAGHGWFVPTNSLQKLQPVKDVIKNLYMVQE